MFARIVVDLSAKQPYSDTQTYTHTHTHKHTCPFCSIYLSGRTFAWKGSQDAKSKVQYQFNFVIIARQIATLALISSVLAFARNLDSLF